jgi:hypothetical protein
MSPYWIILSLFVLSLGGIAVLKGKYVLAAIGIVVPFWAWPVAAVRLAKPHSVWARSFYGEAKMGRAVERYGQEETPEPDPRMTVLAAEIAEHDAPG